MIYKYYNYIINLIQSDGGVRPDDITATFRKGVVLIPAEATILRDKGKYNQHPLSNGKGFFYVPDKNQDVKLDWHQDKFGRGIRGKF